MHISVDKIRGVIFGQAIGDALGLGTEFMSKSEVKRLYPGELSDYSQIITDSHRARWYKGDWTDDTDMMLCILKSYARIGKVDYKDIARSFKDWRYGGGMGIGSTMRNVLSLGDYVDRPYEAAKSVWQLSRQRQAANGGVMRTAIVGTFEEHVTESAENICRLTHYDMRCIGSCVIIAQIVHTLIYENSRLDYEQISAIANRYDSRIQEYVDLAYAGNLDALMLDEEEAMGYTLKTLGAALWAYWHATSFEEGIMQVVNAGGDADTNAAVTGAVLGAMFGYGTFPARLVEGLYRRLELEHYVSWFIAMLSRKECEDDFNLQRFLDAQTPVYREVEEELREGRKRSHWMWFFFPQIKGLGYSSISQYYSISSKDEAIAYLSHPILGFRLTKCCLALLGHNNLTADAIFGEVDAAKLRSSMTLFDAISGKSNIFNKVLQKYFGGKGCERTSRFLQQ